MPSSRKPHPFPRIPLFLPALCYFVRQVGRAINIVLAVYLQHLQVCVEPVHAAEELGIIAFQIESSCKSVEMPWIYSHRMLNMLC